MKKIFLLLFMFCGISLLAQSQTERKLFTLDGNDIGGYIGVNGRYTTINSLGAGLIDVRISVVINQKWAVGFNTSGLLNDRHLNTLVKDGVYHLMGSYKGLYLERIIPINDDLRTSVSLMIGEGTVMYRYCRSEIANKKWYEDIIDQTDFYIIEPTVEIYDNIWDNLWLGLNFGYNFTTPIRMMDTDEALLNNFNAGLSIKYGMF
jgi:hypothetical protein